MINPSVDTGCMKGTMLNIYTDEEGPAAAIKRLLAIVKTGS